MWMFQAFCVVILSFRSLTAAKSRSIDKFEVFHAKSLSTAPVKLDDASYDDLTSGSRNFTAAVILTALEARFGCQLCRDFQPEWDLIGKSWIRGDKQGESRIVFGTLDFADGKETFQKVYSLAVLLVLYKLC